MKFIKIQANGNDYICLDGRKNEISDIERVAQELCDRHLGVGADGLILLVKSEKADFGMRIFNLDGSEAQMCGNGIRCLGKYVYEQGITKRHFLKIETLSGIRELYLEENHGKVEKVRVDMGYPRLNAYSIPVISKKDIVIKELMLLGNECLEITAVSMGNPHIVIFVSNIDACPVEKYGRELEKHAKFPERTNVEFCKVTNENELHVRVWERGVGETLSCGTGACAAVVASVLNHDTNRRVMVIQKGGKVLVEWDERTNKVYLTGGAKQVFEGEISWL